MKLIPVRLQDVSKISMTFALARQDGTEKEVLVISSVGEYRSGSAGNPDASFMCGQILAGTYTWNSSGVVLDFRHLSYTWGDQMSLVLRAGRQASRLNLDKVLERGGAIQFEEVPIVVVVSASCFEGLASLLRDEMKEDPSDWLFHSLEDAVNEMCGRI
jgi:hypothetical protein